jgi:N6-adenosine-specific RNA methylase IME4
MRDVAVLDFDEWVERGRSLCGQWKRQGWEIGDWWRDGSHRYGERAKAAARGIFGLEFGTLRNLGRVAEAFETSRRRDVLTFNHHAEVAALPEEQADYLLERAVKEELSTRELRVEVSKIRNAAQIQAPIASIETCTTADLEQLACSGRRFGTIYADPPWLYDNQGTRAATGNHYGGMTVDELCALPVRELAAEDAHLHLWITNGFLFDAPRIFDAWGFEFRSTFIWVKPQMGIGNYWRNSHEMLLTAVRGDAKRFNDHSMKSWGEFDRTQHSAKPEQIRDLLQRASDGPYLELFGRRQVTGWTVWGNQIERNLFYSEAA